MINRYTYRGVEWVDLESPTRDEVQLIMDERKFNPVLAQELTTPTLKPKVDLYRGYFYLVLHFPAIRHSHAASLSQEIDFVVGRDFIVTTHYDTIDPLQEFAKIFEVSAITDRGDMGDHAGYVFYHMLKHIYKGMGDELEGIKERLSVIETNIFKGKEAEMVIEISKVGRDILDIKGSLRPHASVLDSLQVAAVRLFGDDFEYPMHSLKNESYRISEEVLHASDLAVELRETNNMLVSTRQNDVMKQLNVIAFIALPIGLLLTLLQIGTVSNPIVGRPGDFWAITLMVILLAVLLYRYTKAQKWL